MNSDSHFLIGHSHHICEDYALSGNIENIYYAIVADGCSASKDVDIGARILAKTAENVVRAIHSNRKSYNFENIMGRMIISNAQRTIRGMGLPDSSLDATLLIIISDDLETCFFSYGDGVFSYIDIDGDLHVYDIEYESGAPYYLSYLLDEERNRGYQEEFGGGLLKVHHYWENCPDWFIKDDVMNWTWLKHTERFNIITTDAKQFVSIMSDGIKTFHNISCVESAKEFMSFKNFQGDFVKRRMNSIKRKCQREGIIYDDDISMATIYLLGEV